MRIAFRAASVLTAIMLVVSCGGLLKKGEKDAGEVDAAAVVEAPEAAPPPPTPAPTATSLASNEGDVARFPDEVAINNESATLQRAYNAREAPPAGPVVASLSKGTHVTKIASRDRYFLIVFDNPKAPGTKQMGWVHKDAFSAVLQDAGPLVCPAGEIALFSDTPFCGKPCTADKDCPAQQACKGPANKLLPNGKAGDHVTVCTVYHGPTPPPVDAGRPAVVDAGRIVDASHAPPPPPPPPSGAGDVVPATNNACSAGYVFVKKTGKCHRPCPGGPLARECKNTPNFCIKCDADQKKVCGESQLQCR
jgi:hypothetical protein